MPPGKIIVMQEISRPERFAVLKRETTETLTQDERGARALTAALTEDLTAPPDRRLNRELGSPYGERLFRRVD